MSWLSVTSIQNLVKIRLVVSEMLADRHTDMLEFGLVNTKKLKVAHIRLPSVGFRS